MWPPPVDELFCDSETHDDPVSIIVKIRPEKKINTTMMMVENTESYLQDD